MPDNGNLYDLLPAKILVVMHLSCEERISSGLDRIGEQEVARSSTDCHRTDRPAKHRVGHDTFHVERMLQQCDEIIGSQIQLVEFHLAGGTRLGTTVYGRGNRLEGKAEGAIYKNVLFTNLLGPALVKNPWFAEALLREVLKTKGAELPEKLPEETFDLERKSAACIRRFIEEKTK